MNIISTTTPKCFSNTDVGKTDTCLLYTSFGLLHQWLTDMGMTISKNTLRNWLKKGKTYLPYSLVQCHQSRVYKSDYHDSRCGRRLDHRRDHSSDQNRFDTVGSQFLEDLLHLVAGSRFQTVAHHLHSVQERCV